MLQLPERISWHLHIQSKTFYQPDSAGNFGATKWNKMSPYNAATLM